MMKFRLFLRFTGALLLLGLLSPVRAEPPSHGVKGWLSFSRQGQIYFMNLDGGTPQSAGPGRWPRWSRDGRFVVAWNQDHFVAVERETGKRHRVPGTLNAPSSEAFFDVHPNGTEVVTIDPEHGIVALHLRDGTRRPLHPMQHFYTGELGISADGTRLAARGRPSRTGRGTNHLYAIDLSTGQSRSYITSACSSGVSPDGQWLMNNGDNGNQTHHRMNLRRWDGSGPQVFHTHTLHPRVLWDNQHWSNHLHVIAAEIQGGGIASPEAGLLRLDSGHLFRLTEIGNVEYPDIWVESVAPSGEKREAAPAPRDPPTRAVTTPTPPRRLEARLLRKAELPTSLEYAEALVSYEYITDQGDKLYVVHRALTAHAPVPHITRRQIGSRYTLTVSPFEENATLQSLFLLDPWEDFESSRWWDNTPVPASEP